MQRPSIPWFWILLPVLFLVLPGPARRLLLDLLGGLTLTLLLLPLLVGGLAVLGWQVLRRRLRTCEACGFSSLGSPVCPACGTPFPEGRTDRDLDARNVTINVEAVDVGRSGAPPLPTPPPPGSTGSSAAADQSPPPGS